jgi:hypothetical protein
MSLFKTQDELKAVVPIVKAGAVADWNPTITAAEQFYLKKILGTALYNTLHTAVAANTVSGALTALLPYARAVSGNLGVYEWLPLIYSQTSSAGERTTSTQDAERSPKWSFDIKRKQLLEHGGRAIEDLYEFLEANESNYSSWAGSTYRQYFINKATDFTKHVNIGSSRWTFLALVPEMENVELLYIKPILGDSFYDSLKAKIADKSIAGAELQLVKDLQKPIALLTIGEAMPALNLLITADGIRLKYERNESEYTTPADDASVLERRANDYKMKGKGILHNIKLYLDANAGNNQFALYFNSTNYTAPVTGDEVSRLPDLGNDRRDSIFSF